MPIVKQLLSIVILNYVLEYVSNLQDHIKVISVQACYKHIYKIYKTSSICLRIIQSNFIRSVRTSYKSKFYLPLHFSFFLIAVKCDKTLTFVSISEFCNYNNRIKSHDDVATVYRIQASHWCVHLTPHPHSNSCQSYSIIIVNNNNYLLFTFQFGNFLLVFMITLLNYSRKTKHAP